MLGKTSKDQLLVYQSIQPKMSDLELISLSLTAEFMSRIVRMNNLGNFQRLFSQK